VRAHVGQQNALILVLGAHVIEVDVELIVFQLLRIDFDGERRIKEAEHILGQVLAAG